MIVDLMTYGEFVYNIKIIVNTYFRTRFLF